MSSLKHPKGLYLLFVTEMWERFSYYGMRAIFALYLTKALLFDKAFASNLYGSYTGLVYLTPLLGGYIADRYWGNRRSILVGGIMMACGQFMMFTSGMFYENVATSSSFLYLGLTLLILGNGFFKPNISTMVGQLYPEGDKRVDSAFTIFYMGINLGAFIAPLVCGGLGEVYDANGMIVPSAFKWGFLAAGIGMIISIISFEMLKNKYIVKPDGSPVGAVPTKVISTNNETKKSSVGASQLAMWSGIAVALFVLFKGVLAFDLVGSFIYTACLVAPATIITDKSLTTIEKQRIWVIFILSFFVIFFWSAFEQAGASLTFFAQEQTDRSFMGKSIPSSYFQSINAVAIVIFAPLFAILWTKLGSRNMEPASPVKQAIGLFLLAVGYFIIALGVKDLDPNIKVSMMWLVTLYTVHTFGELCLSPIGLSMVVKLAPVRFASLLMGVWFLSTASANKFAGDLSKLYPEEVKLEKSVPASVFSINKLSNDSSVIFTVDSNSVLAMSEAGNANWGIKLLSDNDAKPTEPGFMEKLFGKKEEAPKKDSLLAVNQTASTPTAELSEFKLKQIIPADAKFKYVKQFSADGNRLYVLKSTQVLEVWNVNPEKPKFVGKEIKNLYDFFMIFVVMAGVASIILYLLSKKLLKMMNGVQ